MKINIHEGSIILFWFKRDKAKNKKKTKQQRKKKVKNQKQTH